MPAENSPSATILVAEDDARIREALDRILRFEGYATICVDDGAAALEAVTELRPDAAILDVMMPFVYWVSVVRRLRDYGDRTPVLMLTARKTPADRVAGLDAGVDDYLPKPFDLEELLARVRALLRRGIPDSIAASMEVDDLSLDVAKRRVRRGDRSVELTKTEFDTLELLMRNVDIVMTRSHLYEEI